MVIQNLKKYMKQQLMAPKLEVQTQTLSATMGWTAPQWMRFFETNGVHIDTAFCAKLKAELIPTSGVSHTISMLHLGVLHQAHARCQYHHVRAYAHKLGLLHTPSLETICMFRKDHFYSKLIETYAIERTVVLIEHPQRYGPHMQLIMGHRYDHDFLFANPLHTNSPIAVTSGVMYAG